MRVGLQTWGSDGDIRPVLALAGALTRRGHQVEVVATSVDGTDYRALASSLAIPLRMVPERLDTNLADLAARSGGSSRKLLRLMLDAAFTPYLPQLTAASDALCRRNDVVVGHFMMWQLKAVALRLQRLHAGFVPWPGMVPSRLRAPPGFPAVVGTLGWRVLQAALNFMVGADVRRAFVHQGLQAPRQVLPDALLSDRLNLLAASPSLCAAPADWHPHHRLCGAFSMPEASEAWAPEGELAAFLDEGPPPVFLSLGSSEQVAPERTRELLVGAARQSKLRCLVQLKSERSTTPKRDQQLVFVPRAPHAQLFARCAAVVHHGGAGTTHSAALAGVPSIVVPFVFEQADWGRRLHTAGGAVAPLDFWKATPDTLAERIKAVVADEALRTSCRALASTMSREDGASQAVRLLEELMSGSAA